MHHESISAAANALHAAQSWLQRIGADPGSVVVVTIAPSAAVGVWAPGEPNVRRLGEIDDSASELCEAAGPAAARALELLGDAQRVAVLTAAAAGARLQLLLCPASEELELSLDNGKTSVTLTRLVSSQPLH